jgi:hypothetical protein
METFYKYRSIQDFKRFLDILVYERLYATEFHNLNDPMEGVFSYAQNIDPGLITNLRSEKSKTKICSLSKTYKNGLMWSFYADSHKGCCIEVEPVGNSWTRLDVDYDSTIYNLTANPSVKDILSRKSKHWEHEQEVRFIKTLNSKKRISPYLKVRIKKIYLGMRMDARDERVIKKIVETINKNKKDKITVERITKTDIDFGYI